MAAPTRTSLSAMALASVYAALLPVAPQLCERRSAQSPEGLPPPALRRSPGAARRWRGEAGFGPSSGRGLSRTVGSLSWLLRNAVGAHLVTVQPQPSAAVRPALRALVGHARRCPTWHPEAERGSSALWGASHLMWHASGLTPGWLGG